MSEPSVIGLSGQPVVLAGVVALLSHDIMVGLANFSRSTPIEDTKA